MPDILPHRALDSLGRGDIGSQTAVIGSPTSFVTADFPILRSESDTYAIYTRSGEMHSQGRDQIQGLFHHDMEHLSELGWQLNGQPLVFIGMDVSPDRVLLVSDLKKAPDVNSDGNAVLKQTPAHLRCTQFLWDGRLHQELAVTNHSDEQKITLTVRFGAKFNDMIHLRGSDKRTRVGVIDLPDVNLEEGTVRLNYDGADGIYRRTHLRFSPLPQQLDGEHAEIELSLARGETAYVYVEAGCNRDVPKSSAAVAFQKAKRNAVGNRRRHVRRFPQITTDNPVANRVFENAVRDVATLLTKTKHGLYPYAGLPFFNVPFGRDGLIIALFTRDLAPEIAEGVLRFHQAHQAKIVDPAHDAEPGKGFHEIRRGEMSNIGDEPFAGYYGAGDPPMLNPILAGRLLARTGHTGLFDDHDTPKSVMKGLKSNVMWMETYGDPLHENLSCCECKAPNGVYIQNWTDSGDAIHHSDGRLATGSIAAVDLQGYAYLAFKEMALIARRMGDHGWARKLEDKARIRREVIEQKFWNEEQGIYALALDGDRTQCLVPSSNMGHLLWAGVPSKKRARIIADRLMARDFWSGWGVRTKPTSAKLYDPSSYHNGSVWAHDNAILAIGMLRYGFYSYANKILRAMIDMASESSRQQMPELVCGFDRTEGCAPRPYVGTCVPHGFAAAAPLGVLMEMMKPRYDRGKLQGFKRPAPAFLGTVTVDGKKAPRQKLWPELVMVN